MTEANEKELDCTCCKLREESKAFLEKNVTKEIKINLLSKYIRLIEKREDPPKYCLIKGKESLYDGAFQIFIGQYYINIPYSAIRKIWEDKIWNKDIVEIGLELKDIIVFDESAEDGKKLRLVQSM